MNYKKELREYILKNIKTTLKDPYGYIKYPFIDPGSVYKGNVWDWDTYWSLYSLLNIAEESGIKDRIIEHGKGNVLNFLDHQLDDGYIAMALAVLENMEEPYLNQKHKEGIIMNMHKPFLCNQICIISDYISDYSWIKKYIPQLEKYFVCYDEYYLNENCQLYVWADDIMIGMDNDPATFGRPKFSTANIFLNSFMVKELESMSKILTNNGLENLVYKNKSAKLKENINKEMYDKRDKFFYSVDVDIKTRKFDWFHEGLGVFWKTLPIKIRTWSGFIPMLVGFATEEQAREMVKHIFDENTFSSKYGITTLSKDEKMFNLSVTNNPSNWLGPIWLVANYVVFRGLMNYGYQKEAKQICDETVELLGKDIEKSGSLHEYYNPFNGNPVMNGGFLNWNMLVLNMIDELDGKQPIGN
ncbi:MAG: MGH1-like glycoside hydrolase domain-containing protein [Lachnospirales bacterium]